MMTLSKLLNMLRGVAADVCKKKNVFTIFIFWWFLCFETFCHYDPFLYRSQSPRFWSMPRRSKIPGFVGHCPSKSPICSTKNHLLQQQQQRKHQQNHPVQKLRNVRMWSPLKNRKNLKLWLHPVPDNQKARQVLQICRKRRKLLLLHRQSVTNWKNLRQRFRLRAKRARVEATTQARVRVAARKVENEIEKRAEVLILTETSRVGVTNETIIPTNLRLENAIKRMKKFRWRHRQLLNRLRGQQRLRKSWPLRNSNLNLKNRCL